MNLENYECEGQLNIFDVLENESQSDLNFEYAYMLFHEECIHRGYHRGATEEHPASWMCSWNNKQKAKCWEDWIECTINNCPLRS